MGSAEQIGHPRKQLFPAGDGPFPLHNMRNVALKKIFPILAEKGFREGSGELSRVDSKKGRITRHTSQSHHPNSSVVNFPGCSGD